MSSSPSPNHHSMSSILHSCKTIKHLKQLHSHVIRTGIPISPLHHHQMLAFCCSPPSAPADMDYARLLFDAIPTPDVSAFNTMIRGFSNQHAPFSAVSFYLKMLAGGLRPDEYTFPFLLKAFDRDAAIAFGDELHAHVLKFGLASNAFAQNALIHMYALSGDAGAARELFDRSPKRNVVMWNALMSGYYRSKQFRESCELFEKMEKENVKPNPASFVSVFSACAKSKNLELGSRIHHMVVEDGMVQTLAIENAILDMYTGCGDMNAAYDLFQKMKVRDAVSWTTMFAGFANAGEIARARLVFDQMPERDFVSLTVMINGYVQASHFKEALQIFRQMQMDKIDPDPDQFTMVSLLTACAQLGALEVGEWIRVYMERNQIKMDIFVGNALIDMYCKCGCVERAAEIFRNMNQRDKFTWTAMINGLAVNRHGEEALEIFYQMLRSSAKPDEITYTGVLSACSHAGLVKKGRELFTIMITSHGIMPNVTHYGCLVDLLGQAGHLKEALETINNMPMRPNSTVWATLLGACRVYKNIEMAELAAEQLLELEPDNSAVYVLLSNIYAKCNKWKEVNKVRMMMMERGIRKAPGCSLIEMNGMLHEFVAGDRSHPRSEEIYSKLEEIGKKMKLAGHVPDVSEALLDMNEETKETAVYQHSEKLAIAFGLLSSGNGVTIRVVKNLRICVDCHNAINIVSRVYGREIVVRDRTRFHHFRHGLCSCKNFW